MNVKTEQRIAEAIIFVVILAIVGIAVWWKAAHSDTEDGSITLTWTAPGTIANPAIGRATGYDLRYIDRPDSITQAAFDSMPRWNLMPLPDSAGRSQTVTVVGLKPGVWYWFALKSYVNGSDSTGNVIQLWSLQSNNAHRWSPITKGLNAVTDLR